MALTLAAFFYKFIFIPIIFPCFALTFIGKPVFIVKIINKIIHYVEPIKNFEVFNFLLGICAILSLVAFYNYYDAQKTFKVFKKMNGHIGNPKYEEILRDAHSSERNFYIYISGCILLLIVHKLTERYLRMAKTRKEIKELEAEMKKLVPEKSMSDKKKD